MVLSKHCRVMKASQCAEEITQPPISPSVVFWAFDEIQDQLEPQEALPLGLDLITVSLWSWTNPTLFLSYFWHFQNENVTVNPWVPFRPWNFVTVSVMVCSVVTTGGRGYFHWKHRAHPSPLDYHCLGPDSHPPPKRAQLCVSLGHLTSPGWVCPLWVHTAQEARKEDEREMKYSSAPILSFHKALVLHENGTKDSSGPWILLADWGSNEIHHVWVWICSSVTNPSVRCSEFIHLALVTCQWQKESVLCVESWDLHCPRTVNIADHFLKLQLVPGDLSQSILFLLSINSMGPNSLLLTMCVTMPWELEGCSSVWLGIVCSSL